MIKLKEIIVETDVSKYKTWYHVNTRYLGPTNIFKPEIPTYTRLKGEDKRTPRVSVTHDWRNAIHMLIILYSSQYWYVYETNEVPIDPVARRLELLQQKKIRSTSNDFRSPDAEVGAEAWFLEPIKMKYSGIVDIGRDAILRLKMSMGMSDGGINYKKLKLEPNLTHPKTTYFMGKEYDYDEFHKNIFGKDEDSRGNKI